MSKSDKMINSHADDPEYYLPFYEKASKVITFDCNGRPFYNENHPQKQNWGKPAGRLDRDGYREIMIRDKGMRVKIRANRLSWFQAFGYISPLLIDHINRVRDDDRIENLREATWLQNSRNTAPQKRTARHSKLKGVTLLKNIKEGNKRWRADLKVGNKTYNKWAYTEEEAGHYYDEMALEHFGDFSYLNFPKDLNHGG